MATTSEATLVIDNPSGLHLRPAARFVRTTSGFKSTIHVQNLERAELPEVDAKSMFGIMRIGVRQGDRIKVRAEGDDAEAAIAALRSLIAGGLEEEA